MQNRIDPSNFDAKPTGDAHSLVDGTITLFLIIISMFFLTSSRDFKPDR